MAEDPYKVLGVPRDAPDEEIRSAYRKLAKQLHPDLNPVNKASAEERFKKVSGAYDIVGDPVKRKQYDRGEIDANGEARRGYHRTHAGGAGPFSGRAGGGARPGSGDDFGFGDIFSDLFGGRARRGEDGGFATRGRDVRYTLEIDFLEAAAGAKKRVTMPDGGVLDLTVPEGVADGQVLRLKGKGSPGAGGSEAGDALVEIKVRPHAQFTRSRRRHRAGAAHRHRRGRARRQDRGADRLGPGAADDPQGHQLGPRLPPQGQGRAQRRVRPHRRSAGQRAHRAARQD